MFVTTTEQQEFIAQIANWCKYFITARCLEAPEYSAENSDVKVSIMTSCGSMSRILLIVFIWSTVESGRTNVIFSSAFCEPMSMILSGRNVPAVSTNSTLPPSFAQLADSVKHSWDLPEPLCPKMSVTMPWRIPPPKSESIAAEPVEIANDDDNNNTDSPAYELLLQNTLFSSG